MTYSDRFKQGRAIRLSNRQHAGLRTFIDLGKRGSISARTALDVDERTLKSLVYNELIEFNARTGFKATDLGFTVYHDYENTDIFLQRKKPKTHYGSFLQSIDEALSGTFRHKSEGKAIPINHGKRKARKAA